MNVLPVIGIVFKMPVVPANFPLPVNEQLTRI